MAFLSHMLSNVYKNLLDSYSLPTGQVFSLSEDITGPDLVQITFGLGPDIGRDHYQYQIPIPTKIK